MGVFLTLARLHVLHLARRRLRHLLAFRLPPAALIATTSPRRGRGMHSNLHLYLFLLRFRRLKSLGLRRRGRRLMRWWRKEALLRQGRRRRRKARSRSQRGRQCRCGVSPPGRSRGGTNLWSLSTARENDLLVDPASWTRSRSTLRRLGALRAKQDLQGVLAPPHLRRFRQRESTNLRTTTKR